MKKIFAILLCLISLIPVFSQTPQATLAAKFDARIKDEWTYGLSKQFGFNAAGNLFFAIDDNKKLTIWETENQNQKYTLTGKFSGAEFSPDGKWLAIFSKKEILIVDSENGKNQAVFSKPSKKLYFHGWNPNSKNIAIGTQDFTVDIVDAQTGKLKSSFIINDKKKGFLGKIFDDGFVGQAIFTPDGTKILTTSDDPTAELWDLETGKILYTFTLRAASPFQGALPKLPEVSYAAISPDGKWILTGSFDQNRLWKTETGKLAEEFSGYSFPTFSPDSHYLGMVTDSTSKYRATALFDLSAQKIISISDKYNGEIVAWSSDSEIFITDRTTDEMSKNAAYIWESKTGKQKAEIKTYSKGCLDFVSTCLSDFDIFRFSPTEKF